VHILPALGRINPALILRSSCIPEKVGVNKKGINKNDILVRNGCLRNRTQPSKGRKTENGTDYIKRWCKFAKECLDVGEGDG
jgi:hypothetical protein